MSLIPAFAFGATFVAVGVACIGFALKGQTFAQDLNEGECAGLGSVGAAFFMAAGAGLLGAAFLAEAVFDPAGIKSSVGGMRLDAVRVNAHFGIGSVAFILGGIFLLYLTPAIYRSTHDSLTR